MNRRSSWWRFTLLRVLTAAYLNAALGELQKSCNTAHKNIPNETHKQQYDQESELKQHIMIINELWVNYGPDTAGASSLAVQLGMWTMAEAASYTTISFLFLRQLSMKSNSGLSWLSTWRQNTSC